MHIKTEYSAPLLVKYRPIESLANVITLFGDSDFEFKLKFKEPLGHNNDSSKTKIKILFMAEIGTLSINLKTNDHKKQVEHTFQTLIDKLKPFQLNQDDIDSRLLRGKITTLKGHMNYGILTTNCHEEVYFHRNSFLDNSFENLSLGNLLEFEIAIGVLGPQAINIKIIS